MPEATSSDRHRKGSVQLKAWVPEELRAQFNDACKTPGVPAASVLRDMMEAYCAQVAAAVASAGKTEAVDGQG